MAYRLVGRPTPAEAAAEDPESRDYLELSAWKLPGFEGTTHFYFGVDPLLTLAPLAKVSRGTGFLTVTPTRTGSSGGWRLSCGSRAVFIPASR